MRDSDDASISDGLAVRRAMFGEELVERNYTNASDFNRPAQDWIAGAVWADVWTRDGLDRRTRSLVTLAILTSQGRTTEFESHVRAARTNGCSVADIQELLLHTAPYCGAPAALQAFRLAERVLAEADGAGS